MADYAKVDAFLATLTPWELVYARTHFRTLTISGLASLPDLPSELVCHIATQLSLPDILAARQVSRSWRAAWTHGPVVSGVCHHFFSGLLELYNARTHWGSARELFDAAAKRYLTRYYARPARTAFISWDAGWNSGVFTNRKPLDARNPPSFRRQVCFYAQGPPVFYARGILAWQPAKSYVIVDDLRSCRRSVCMLTPILMSGQLISLHAVSERLLIFAATNNGHNYNTA